MKTIFSFTGWLMVQRKYSGDKLVAFSCMPYNKIRKTIQDQKEGGINMFIIRFIVLLPFRILAFVLSLILTIIRIFIDITAKMSSYVSGPLLFFIVGCLIYSLVKQSWNDCILLTIMASAVIAVYYVAGFISAEIDYLASLLMDFVHS